MTTLLIENLTKRFKSETVLDDLTLEVASGETLVIFGPSGAGKTILLRAIAGAVEPDHGRIVIGGVDVTNEPPERRGIGMAFQNFALFPHMTAFENIASPLLASKSARAKIQSGVEHVARLLKIDHVLTHTPRALSNGQKQRTALARALAGAPAVLLPEDPHRHVDAKLRFEMRLELPRLLARQGSTVVYVTQDYKEAMALGDRIAVLDRGQIAQFGSPEDIYDSPANIEIARLFGDPTINLLDVMPEQDSVGVFVRISDQRVPIDPGLSGAVGKPCVIGLRPETISFTTASEGVPILIEAETPFNEKTVTLAIKKRSREILISRPSGAAGPIGGEARIMVRARDAMLFDKETGLLIKSSDQVGGRAEAAA